MSENQDSNIRIYQRKPDYWKEKKDLEVVTYRNYGNTITGEDNELRFYFSFYQLNNHKVICVQYIVYEDKKLTPDIYFYYSNCYQFEDDFWEYWERNNEENDKFYKKLRKIEDEETRRMMWKNERLFEDEAQCVKDFFYKNVVKEKNKKTEIINV
tara:strand:- start:95 stop:559 length:465 start_codon:yes stop_codon:yes gene_type:complete